ncbi:HP1 family phage holin [Vibrio sp. 1982]|uniref:HP1 family phage holin n=1 Tax=Vibrio sp. 1982 TaxID=3074586 RepID=UPI0029643EBF|nr:HP1 family phage holin [Vibrio sp. 1982]MDW2216218.1 HP1 family phage holin [Vibrio sp. 1982]
MNPVLMDKSVTTSSYIASVSTALGGFFSMSDLALLIGIASTVVLSVMQYRMYKRRGEQDRIKAKQDAEYHAARMKALAAGNSECSSC